MRKLLDRCDTETDSLILGELDIAKILSEGRFKMTDGNKKETFSITGQSNNLGKLSKEKIGKNFK